MTKAKGKNAGRTSKSTRYSALRKPVDLDALRQRITNQVGGKAVEMVKTATEECAKVGNLSALKYLFEVIGLYPPSATANAERADSDDLARELLNRLEFGQEADPEDGKVARPAEAGSDWVE
jgi:hypothetical protein